MFLKGILYNLYDNKFLKFYPKTLAEQVLISHDSTTTLLDKLVSMSTGITDVNPDNAINNGQTYIISNSDKMPTTGKYTIVPIKCDDTLMYQQAICIDTQEKVERWFNGTKWSNWAPIANESLSLASAYIKCKIDADKSYSFTNPVNGFDITTQSIEAIIINTSYITPDKFTVTNSTITLNDTERPVDIIDDVYVVLHQLVKGGAISYNYDGSKIGAKTITEEKIADTAFMTANDVVNNTGDNKIVGKEALNKKSELDKEYANKLIESYRMINKDDKRFFTGTLITGTDTNPSKYNTNLDNIIVDDEYLNIETGCVYKCVLSGDQDTAEWIYFSNINKSIIIQLNEMENNINQLSNPNLLINGDFRIWQRGDNIICTPGIKYTADRWAMWNGANNTNISKASNSLKWQCGSNDNLIQMVEMPISIIGKDLTLSCFIKAPLGVTVGIQAMGVSTLNEETTPSTQNYVGTGVWSKVVINIPTKFNNKDLFKVSFGCGVNNVPIELTNVKLEVGTKATPFIPRPYGEELTLCQRYYWTNENIGNIAQYWGYVNSIVSNGLTLSISLGRNMRIVPTVTLNGTRGNDYELYYNNNFNNAGTFDLSSQRSTQFIYLTIKNATLPTYNYSNTSLFIGKQGILCVDAEIY